MAFTTSFDRNQKEKAPLVSLTIADMPKASIPDIVQVATIVTSLEATNKLAAHFQSDAFQLDAKASARLKI